MNKQQRASRAVSAAIQRGELSRPDRCELCGLDGPSYDRHTGLYKVPQIVAHHHAGYHRPLDVWFICRSCNSLLKHRHDGSLTREQARELIAGPITETRVRVARGEAEARPSVPAPVEREEPGVFEPLYVVQQRLW